MDLMFASHNRGKWEELQQLAPKGIRILRLDEVGWQEALPEWGQTYEENAFQKVHTVYVRLWKPCFSEDSGLEVLALQGQPGTHSAHFAGPNANDIQNCQKLIQLMNGAKDRSARFVSVICLIFQGKPFVFSGYTLGHIAEERRGTSGFGYDALFIPEGHDLTFAEMSTEQKNRFSHRAKAARCMYAFLSALY